MLIYKDLHEDSFYMPPRIFKAHKEEKVTQKHYESMKEDIIQRTCLKKKEEEAAEKIRKLSRFRERIIQDANIWLTPFDNDANVMVWNRAEEEISGYSKEEVVGHDKIWE